MEINTTRPRHKANRPLTRADYIACVLLAALVIVVILIAFAARGGL